ncbi:MAG: hypothetical protein KKC76_04025 [Proteobacteria bacterium]|nr:hypothetical protein [Pseudomonadota bacterium]MBU4296383.1 hypothetical protein [Pseudomonadota bacterium]MCG2750067.1 hypothetical protein [Desulfobulbaceae bacterium]
MKKLTANNIPNYPFPQAFASFFTAQKDCADLKKLPESVRHPGFPVKIGGREKFSAPQLLKFIHC